jgi:hypothetical protein
LRRQFASRLILLNAGSRFNAFDRARAKFASDRCGLKEITWDLR